MTKDELIAFEARRVGRPKTKTDEQLRLAKAERGRRYYEKNKDRLRPIRAAWAKNNRDNLRAADRRWKQRNRQKISELASARRAKNIDERRAKDRALYHKNKEVRLAKQAEYRKRKPEVFAHHAAARRAAEKRAMPPWVDKAELQAIYDRAAEAGLTVDHIVPLVHPLVCGLHVPWNLQMLTLEANSSKHNRFEVWS